jgi:tRNA modification GTPase
VLATARERVDELLDLVPAGRRLREGVQVVLVGAPNAGKSSLFNALLDQPRAIVDDAPGTTRDVVSEALELEGLLFVLHDTAGLHAAAVGVEAEGVRRARELLARADIVLAVSSCAPEEAVAATAAEPPGTPAGSARLEVHSKSDLAAGELGDGLRTSATTGEGLEALRRALVEIALASGLQEAAARGVVLNQRHQDRLLACRASLDELLAARDAGDEVVASLLSAVLQELGAISGRVFTEQLLGDIFGRFCVGK